MRLIDADALFAEDLTDAFVDVCDNEIFEAIVERAPTVYAVSANAYEQVLWERDVAMEQLKEHGIPFGGIAPNVVEVVRCKDCKHGLIDDPELPNWYFCSYHGCDWNYGEHFCSYGERKEE